MKTRSDLGRWERLWSLSQSMTENKKRPRSLGATVVAVSLHESEKRPWSVEATVGAGIDRGPWSTTSEHGAHRFPPHHLFSSSSSPFGNEPPPRGSRPHQRGRSSCLRRPSVAMVKRFSMYCPLGHACRRGGRCLFCLVNVSCLVGSGCTPKLVSPSQLL